MPNMPENFWITTGVSYATISGGVTTPVPLIDVSTDRKCKNSLIRVQQWLIDNAIAESLRRDDDFNGRPFQQMNARRLSPADIDVLNMYLWDAKLLTLTAPGLTLSPEIQCAA